MAPLRRHRVSSRSLRRLLPGGEPLESRRLLTAAPWLITADANPAAFDDIVIIRGSVTDATQVEVVLNGVVVGSQPIADPRPIEIHTGLGDDIVRVDVPGLTTPLRIFAGPGDDTVFAGDGDDLIDGGSGDDTLIGRGGNDRIRGRLGHDILLGEDGDDLLRGGGGADTLVAGPGQDRLGGGAELDRMFAALGSDRLNLEAIDVAIESKQANPVFKARGPLEYQRFLRASRALTVTGSGLVRTAAVLTPSLAFDMTAAATADASGTNNQVAGVEEADLVKTDGIFIYAVINGELLVIDADPASLAVRSRTAVPGSASGLFVHGSRVTVVSEEWVAGSGGWQPIASPWPDVFIADMTMLPIGSNQTVVTVFDLADPAAPVTVEQTRLEGRLLAARSIGNDVYVVVEDDDGVALSDQSGDTAGAGILIPAGGGNSSLLTVARLSPTDDIAGVDDAAVMAGRGGTVYASEQTVYVAAANWSAGGATTTLTAFALGETIEQVASGSISGYVSNQFALDEDADGRLRVVSQEGDWSRTTRSTTLAVLERQGADLVAVGQVSGIAPGEDLKSVRFLDDQAFIVTFLQIDPLFVVDLADPTAPQVTGELEVTGFSSYLHPMGPNRLFGIGRGDEPNTGKLSLFDVATPAAPTLIDAVTLGGFGGWTTSAAAWDHRAFSWFADEGLLAVPVTTWDWSWGNDGQSHDFLVSCFAVDPATGFTHAFDVRHDSPVLRSLRIADRLYTVSSTTLAVHDLGGSHAELGRIVIRTGSVAGLVAGTSA